MTDEAITSDLLLHAYCAGVFPMGDPDTGEISWYSPDPRAIIPLNNDGFHIPKRLAKTVRQGRFIITHDRAFKRVMQQCAVAREGREETWINDEILKLYCELFSRGFAHSIEAWLPLDNDCDHVDPALIDKHSNQWLAGGIYGVAIGAVYFGESMFSNARDASKVCLVHTVEHLRERGYSLFDVQFVNPHLEQFGVCEIPRDEYLKQLLQAIEKPISWRGD